MEFASKFVLNASSDEESWSGDDAKQLAYSDCERYSDSSSSCSEEEEEEKKNRFRRAKVRKADTNVVRIDLNTLAKEAAQYVTGDLTVCKNCSVILNHLSVLKEDSYLSKSVPEQIWECEFCDEKNIIHIEEEERPTEPDCTYVLDSLVTKDSGKEHGNLVVFCIDTSGSMCVTTEVTGKHNLKGQEKVDRLKNLDQQFGDQSDQFMPNQRRDTTWVSRLQCVQAAVDSYMDKIRNEAPDTVICLVTFSNEVKVIGDGQNTPVTIAGDKLYEQDTLFDLGSKISKDITHPIAETYDSLSSQLFSIEESGQTALGPGLVTSLGIAKSTPGSQVIICTDGLSNIGVGAIDEIKEEEEEGVSKFYANLGLEAASNGTSISVISIKGCTANIENLGKLADNSGGQTNVVDPLSLHKEFASILSEPVIATNVEVKFFLHKGLRFRNEQADEEDLEEIKEAEEEKPTKQPKKKRTRKIKLRKKKKEKKTNKEQVTKEEKEEEEVEEISKEQGMVAEVEEKTYAEPAIRWLGNVSASTQITFEFSVNKSYRNNSIDHFPFQVQISYHTLDQKRCIRTITDHKSVTNDRQVAEAEADISVLGLNIAQQTAKTAFHGDYSKARANALAHKKLIKRAKRTSQDESYYKNMKQNLHQMETKLVKTQKKERRLGLSLSDSSDDDDNDFEKERMEERKKRRQAKKKQKNACRAKSRNDKTSAFLFQLKNQNNTNLNKRKSSS
eukprot:CAMPEP_0174264448 /NCGR_PEP_ID=MMETSP0439-20130205/22499_1 /TAXON_ID=0 /ORGANISM="Stereomyxa ramosa, Strain Chinc5" /LENGTH=728 /DNA_ID=CAMNT_0015350323 /DNA_START=17 /DNA_END=2203 /DNA_ORIENTATION=-